MVTRGKESDESALNLILILTKHETWWKMWQKGGWIRKTFLVVQDVRHGRDWSKNKLTF